MSMSKVTDMVNTSPLHFYTKHTIEDSHENCEKKKIICCEDWKKK